MAIANALSADSLAASIVSSLPKNGGSDPSLKTATDAIAIACHAGMLAVGFRLVGLGEDHSISRESASDSTTSTEALPQEWNASTSPAFRYKHSQSSMEFMLKVSRLGGRILVNGIAVEDSKPVDFHLIASDFISASSLPFILDKDVASLEEMKRRATSVFISPSRLQDLGQDLRVNIIQRLMPSLQKEGYEEMTSTTDVLDERPRRRPDPDRREASEPTEPQRDPLQGNAEELPRPRPHPPLADPSIMPRIPSRGPIPDFAPPEFEDEHQMQRPWGRHPLGGAGSMGMPGYGERDLYPPGLGPHDPLRIGGVGGSPFTGGRSGGGMHPTFDDPMFGGRSGADDGYYDPQVPPGARYDPTGPGDARPFRPGGFGGSRGGGGGGPPNPFGGFGSGDFI